MSNQISRLVTDCNRLFDYLDRNKSRDDHIPNILEFDESERLKHQHGRFTRWSRSVGALECGIHSLEHQLRDASHVQLHVIRLLNHIKRLLEDASSISTADKVPWDKTYDDESSSSDDEESPLHESPNTEIEQITMHIAELIDSLLFLSVAMRNPAPHDRTANPIPTQLSGFEPFDVQHVFSKYPAIDSDIAERLGKAITVRRQFFKHREADHTIIVSEASHEKHPVDSTSLEYFERTAGLTGSTLLGNESDEAISETSCASSEAGQEPPQFLALPMKVNLGGRPFECPYCYLTIRVSSSTAWKNHVLDDLQPYICLEKDCATPNHQYSRRTHWMDHVLQNHWSTYVCPFGCELKFQTYKNFRGHIHKDHDDHGIQEDSAEMDDLVRLCAMDNLEIPTGASCPICEKKLLEIKEYRSHVGKHQEQLALLAVSPTETENQAFQVRTETEDDGVNSASLEPGVSRSIGYVSQKPNQEPSTAGDPLGPSEQITRPRDTVDTSAGREGFVGEKVPSFGWQCCNCGQPEWLSLASHVSCPGCQAPRCRNCTYRKFSRN